MEPTRIWHPLFLFAITIAKSAATPSGAEPASFLERYGKTKRSIDFGVPFWKGARLFG
jgi:hypothetical protein